MEPQPERDRWGRPLVVPPEGGKAVPYTRCTTFVDCLDDKWKLQQWQQRMVALGLAARNDLLLSVAAHRNDKAKLDELCDAAREAAAASAAATTGTALHLLAEHLDKGEDLGVVPKEAEADLRAYEQATRDFKALHIEQFMVHDDLKVGGTPDRVVQYEGGTYIADLKTGSVEWAGLKIAMQLAMYAHSRLYDVRTAQRADLAVDQQRAIVIHLPAGSGKASLLWVDIAQGWQAVQVAAQVRQWRKQGKGLLRPLEVQGTLDLPDPAMVDLRNRVASATTVEDLGALWREHRDRWTTELTELAAARKALLAEAAS
jgi:predicted RecB family endonuclease